MFLCKDFHEKSLFALFVCDFTSQLSLTFFKYSTFQMNFGHIRLHTRRKLFIFFLMFQIIYAVGWNIVINKWNNTRSFSINNIFSPSKIESQTMCLAYIAGKIDCLLLFTWDWRGKWSFHFLRAAEWWILWFLFSRREKENEKEETRTMLMFQFRFFALSSRRRCRKNDNQNAITIISLLWWFCWRSDYFQFYISSTNFEKTVSLERIKLMLKTLGVDDW